MKNLLKAIRNQLQQEVVAVRDSDVCIVPDLSYFPAGTKFPCILISDSNSSYKHKPSSAREGVHKVEIAIYTHNKGRGDAHLEGDKALLSISDVLRESLEENTLDLNEVVSAEIVSESGTTLYTVSTTEFYLKNAVVFEYEKETYL